jgi:hypothetical protein
MNAILYYSIGVCFSIGIFFFGRYTLTHPEKVCRFFIFGQRPGRWSIRYFRFLGRFFIVTGAFGIIFYLLAISIALLSKR